ncbi:MAG: UDP-N-acetylmuramate dehydrogenase [Ruminococcaceae bacterium]|nr:UDP-N-acetylmuramate dehydrogenase [Oscillospiraceae bacterium]
MTIKGCEILEFEPLSKYSYMKTGGMAKKIIFPLNRDGLLNALKAETDYYILGNCSNVLFPDSGINKPLIITTKMKKTEVFDDGEFFYITSDTGASLGHVAYLALENSLTGLEFAHGIPGTVGGAVFMNAGAYGGEIKDVFHSCICIDQEGNVKIMNCDEMDFSYRSSILQKEKLILASATFRLKKGEKSQIKALMNDLMERRRTKQPLEYPSVGSFFKRPEGYFAAKLIEDAGLKGFSVGGAQVSEKHAGFVINAGGATTAEILALGEHVEKTVFEKFGVKLEREVRIIV